ncbi:hypothetical protein GCM10018965_008140 [Nonomuraea roseola]
MRPGGPDPGSVLVVADPKARDAREQKRYLTRGIGRGIEPATGEPVHCRAHRDRVAFQPVGDLRHGQPPARPPDALPPPPLVQ